MSVGATPFANAAQQGAAAGAQGTLALTNLSSSDFDVTAPYDSTAGVRVLTSGNVQELTGGGSWSSQNPSTEWIDAFGSGESASDYEVKLTKTAGTDPTSGPSLGVWHTISATRQWELNSTIIGLTSFSGTMDIREIADTGNSVSASVTLTVENGLL